MMLMQSNKQHYVLYSHANRHIGGADEKLQGHDLCAVCIFQEVWKTPRSVLILFAITNLCLKKTWATLQFFQVEQVEIRNKIRPYAISYQGNHATSR